MAKNCINCVHVFEGDIDPQTLKRFYKCRRYPPTAQVISTPQGVANAQMLPTVTETDYCGEHDEKWKNPKHYFAPLMRGFFLG